MSLNVSDFSLLFLKNCNPPEKNYPLFSSDPLSKWSCLAPSFWKFGRSFNPQQKGGRGAHCIFQEQYTIWSRFLVHLCEMIISLGIFFSSLKFSFLGLLGGKRAKNSPKWKTTICHAPYLRNSIAYDHNFWYTFVKW